MAGYRTETQDPEDLEMLAEMDGERGGEGEAAWDGEAIGEPEGAMEAAAGHDLETYLLGESGPVDLEDLEADPFVGNLIRRATRAVSQASRGGLGPTLLKNLAKQAAQVAGGAIGGPTGATIAGQVADRVLRETEVGGDYESDATLEHDFEALCGDPEILEEMQYHAAMAAETEDDREAEQFIGAIANLAGPLVSGLFGGDGEQAGDPFSAGLTDGLFEDGEQESYDGERDDFLPLLAAALPAVLPLVKKGVGAVGKVLRGNRATRPAIRALPRIAAKTAASLARQAGTGRRLTPQRVAATVAQQASRTLASRRGLAQAIQANRVGAGRAQARPSRPLGSVLPPGQIQPTGVYGVGRGSPPPRRSRLIGYVPVYAPRASR